LRARQASASIWNLSLRVRESYVRKRECLDWSYGSHWRFRLRGVLRPLSGNTDSSVFVFRLCPLSSFRRKYTPCSGGNDSTCRCYRDPHRLSQTQKTLGSCFSIRRPGLHLCRRLLRQLPSIALDRGADHPFRKFVPDRCSSQKPHLLSKLQTMLIDA
jgi:hypothetical protein